MSVQRAKSVPERSERLLGERYVQQVCSLPQVRRILLERPDSGWRLWTIISAPPFDDTQRDPLYQAELQVMQVGTTGQIDFRLINVEEFPPDSRTSLIRADAVVLFER